MANTKRKPVGKKAQTRVSAKISHLAHTEPSMPAPQRTAMALSMERAHRLGPGGAYKPVAKKKGR